MKTRVVVMLMGGNYLNAYFPSMELAQAFIKRWYDDAHNAISKGACLTAVYKFSDDVEGWDDQNFAGAALANGIIAMYIANDKLKSAADRIADLAEKQAGEGEEWRR